MSVYQAKSATLIGFVLPLWQGRDALWRREAVAIAVFGLPSHEHLLCVDVDLDTARVEAAIDAEALGGFHVGVAAESVDEKDAIE